MLVQRLVQLLFVVVESVADEEEVVVISGYRDSTLILIDLISLEGFSHDKRLSEGLVHGAMQTR